MRNPTNENICIDSLLYHIYVHFSISMLILRTFQKEICVSMLSTLHYLFGCGKCNLKCDYIITLSRDMDFVLLPLHMLLIRSVLYPSGLLY